MVVPIATFNMRCGRLVRVARSLFGLALHGVSLQREIGGKVQPASRETRMDGRQNVHGIHRAKMFGRRGPHQK